MRLLNPKINLDEFFNHLERTSESVLIIDFDGTLAPFSSDRMKVEIYPQIKPVLQQLIHNEKSRIILASGRALEDLKIVFPFYDAIEIWGSHGLERKKRNGEIESHYFKDQKFEDILNRAKKVCENECKVMGSCEHKPYGLALHWRGLESDQQEKIKERVQLEWEKLIQNSIFEIHHFDGGIEIRPSGKNKGHAVTTILNEIDKETTIAYLGDDRTDEQAFESLGDRGLKILVKGEFTETHADLQIDPPDELKAFLERWLRTQGISHGK